MDDPGPVIGTGRAALVYDLGDGRVLRRYRGNPPPRQTEREAVVMQHLRRHGYPVPVVYDVAGPDLVMERLEGKTMLADLEARPWRVRRHAETWAALVKRLGTVPVGDLVAVGLEQRFGRPSAIVHLDFHPDNIMLTPEGPVVFDWSNASLAPPAADAALSWLVAATSTVDGGVHVRVVVRLLRNRLIDRFVDAYGRVEAEAMLPVVAAYRLRDRNVRPEEAVRIRDMIDELAMPTTGRRDRRRR